jgi:hypothetical protein
MAVEEIEQHVKREIQQAFAQLRLPNLLALLERFIRQVAGDVVDRAIERAIAQRQAGPVMPDTASPVDPAAEKRAAERAAAAAAAKAKLDQARAELAALGVTP